MSSQASELCKLALSLFESKTWRGLTSNHAFALDLPKRDRPIAFSFNTAKTGHPILIIFESPHPVEDLFDDLRSKGNLHREDLRVLFVQRAPRKLVAHPDNQIAELADCKASAIPIFSCCTTDGQRPVEGDEIKLVLEVLRAVNAIEKKGALKPQGGAFDGWVPRFSIRGTKAKAIIKTNQYAVDLGMFLISDKAPDGRPEDDDLKGWKAADNDLVRSIMRIVPMMHGSGDKTKELYFGSQDAGAPEISEGATESAVLSVTDWLGFGLTNSQGLSLAERLLRLDALSPAMRELLIARSKAKPAIYRIVAIEDPLLSIEDIHTGAKFDVTDGQLCATTSTEMLLSMRVFPAGDFYFTNFAGPAMFTAEVEPALEELARQLGVETFDLSENPYALGRLFYWLEKQDHENNLVLQNTHGEALAPLKASYAVENSKSLSAALAAHADVEVEADGSRFTWLSGPYTNPNSVILASLELWHDEVLVEVNSMERHEGIRAWLEAQPGVSLKSVTEVEVDPRKPDTRPLDDRLPGDFELPKELDAATLAMLRERLNATYMGWLDESIPALGGKTPRETVKTKAGRAKVLRMIRTYPDAGGIPGIEVPRDAMIRELGLEGEG